MSKRSYQKRPTGRFQFGLHSLLTGAALLLGWGRSRIDADEVLPDNPYKDYRAAIESDWKEVGGYMWQALGQHQDEERK